MEDDVDLVLQPLGVGVDGESARCVDGVARGCGGGARLLPRYSDDAFLKMKIVPEGNDRSD